MSKFVSLGRVQRTGKPPTHYVWHCSFVVEYVSNYWGLDKAKVVHTGGAVWVVTSLCFKFTPLSLVEEQWYKTSSRVWCMAETVPNNLLYPIHKGGNNIGAAISKLHSSALHSLPFFSDFKLRNVSARDLLPTFMHHLVRIPSWIHLWRHGNSLGQLSVRWFKHYHDNAVNVREDWKSTNRINTARLFSI